MGNARGGPISGMMTSLGRIRVTERHSLRVRVTWHRRAQSYDGGGRHRVSEVDCAAHMIGYVTDESGEQANHGDGHHETHVAASKSCRGVQGPQKWVRNAEV